MVRKALLLLLALVGVLPVVAAPAAADLPPDAASAAGVVVKMRDDAAPADVAGVAGGEVRAGMAGRRAELRLKKGRSVSSAVAALRRDPRVEWVEPNVQYAVADTPNDPCLLVPCGGAAVVQWAPGVVKASQAWSVTHGSPSVLVAVVDGGVDAGHPQLAGKVVTGPDFTGTKQDQCWRHGTHVAGTVAAATNDANGVAGLGWNTRVLAVRVLSYDPGINDCTGYLSDIARGIDAAVSAGARVVNLSLAGTFDSQTLRDSVANAVAKGVVVVAAAGNEYQDGNPVEFPAAIPDVLSVASTNALDQVSYFSERGGWVDMAAPGENIVSTYPGNAYRAMSGTSMASPHVAAAAALLLAVNPGLSARQAMARLMLSSAEFPGAGRDVRYGRLDMYSALLSDGHPGYYMVASDGGIFSFGSRFYGSTGGIKLNQDIVGMTSSPRRRGYWFVASDGGIFSFGDAPFWGSAAGQATAPIVGMAALSDSKGYFLFGADGHVYAFGSAVLPAGAAAFRTGSRVVAGAVNVSGTGIWLAAADGSVFTFGDARGFGSMAGAALNQPIVGMTVTPTGLGYYLVATDGGMFTFGDAKFYGSTGGIKLNQPINGMQMSLTGGGYLLVASDGGMFAFGDAKFQGSMGGTKLNRPVVGMG